MDKKESFKPKDRLKGREEMKSFVYDHWLIWCSLYSYSWNVLFFKNELIFMKKKYFFYSSIIEYIH